MKKMKNILPGIIICLIIGIISEILGKKFSTVGAATFAIFIGIVAGNTIFKGKKYDEKYTSVKIYLGTELVNVY